MSNFTFFHNVFYAICILKSFYCHIPVVICSFFEFGMVSKLCIGEWVNSYRDNRDCQTCFIALFYVGTPQGPVLPRPVLPRERGTMDRILEYLVGDGPQNRYALICRCCHSHNGMALKEEFEYIGKIK